MKVFLHVTFQMKIFTLQTFDETLKYNAFLLTKTEVANLSDLWLTKKQRSFVTPCDISDVCELVAVPLITSQMVY